MLAVLFAMGVLAGPPAAAGGAVWGAEGLAKFVSEARIERADAFEKPPLQAAAVGQQIEIHLPVEAGTATSGDPNLLFWTYDVDKGRLVVEASPTHWDRFELRGMRVSDRAFSIHGFYFVTRYSAGPSYVGQNSYGAKATISTKEFSGYAIAEFATQYVPFDKYPFEELLAEWTLPMAADEARRLVPQLRLIVRATVAGGYRGQNVFCGDRTSSPTVASPLLLKYEYCVVAVDVQSVELVSGTTSLGRRPAS